MNQTLIGLCVLGGMVALLAFSYFRATKNAKAQGRSETLNEVVAAQQEAQEQHEEEVKKEMSDVEDIRSRLESDPAYRSYVRSKFTRKDKS